MDTIPVERVNAGSFRGIVFRAVAVGHDGETGQFECTSSPAIDTYQFRPIVEFKEQGYPRIGAARVCSDSARSHNVAPGNLVETGAIICGKPRSHVPCANENEVLRQRQNRFLGKRKCTGIWWQLN